MTCEHQSRRWAVENCVDDEGDRFTRFLARCTGCHATLSFDLDEAQLLEPGWQTVRHEGWQPTSVRPLAAEGKL